MGFTKIRALFGRLHHKNDSTSGSMPGPPIHGNLKTTSPVLARIGDPIIIRACKAPFEPSCPRAPRRTIPKTKNPCHPKLPQLVPSKHVTPVKNLNYNPNIITLYSHFPFHFPFSFPFDLQFDSPLFGNNIPIFASTNSSPFQCVRSHVKPVPEC